MRTLHPRRCVCPPTTTRAQKLTMYQAHGVEMSPTMNGHCRVAGQLITRHALPMRLNMRAQDKLVASDTRETSAIARSTGRAYGARSIVCNLSTPLPANPADARCVLLSPRNGAPHHSPSPRTKYQCSWRVTTNDRDVCERGRCAHVRPCSSALARTGLRSSLRIADHQALKLFPKSIFQSSSAKDRVDCTLHEREVLRKWLSRAVEARNEPP